MTDQDIAQEVLKMIQEDAKRSPEEQVRDLLEAGVIDAQGRVLIGFWNKSKEDQDLAQRNGPSGK